jgi:hypothetical protein
MMRAGSSGDLGTRDGNNEPGIAPASKAKFVAFAQKYRAFSSPIRPAAITSAMQSCHINAESRRTAC